MLPLGPIYHRSTITHGRRVKLGSHTDLASNTWVNQFESLNGADDDQDCLVDAEDPHDPGWAVPPGMTKLNMYSKERAYVNGFHTFFLRVEDSAKQVRVIKWGLEVLPMTGDSRP